MGTLKLLLAIVLVSVPVILCAERLPKRELFRRRFIRPQAQAAG